jgi:SAM-dependent methyltransferase
MPEESYWESLFDVPLILERLGIDHSLGDVAELGCGYGTFTIPIARSVSGTVHAFDIDRTMIERTQARAAQLPIVTHCRDVMDQGFGLSADAVLLFNILHCESPQTLLAHAAQALNPNGRAMVIHWKYGQTPRGPNLDIRPRPEQIIDWADCLSPVGDVIDLPPWHFGLIFHASGDSRSSR